MARPHWYLYLCRPCLKGRTPKRNRPFHFSKCIQPRRKSEMQGVVSFWVAAVLGGGWCGSVGTESERTLRVRNTTHAARAKVRGFAPRNGFAQRLELLHKGKNSALLQSFLHFVKTEACFGSRQNGRVRGWKISERR